ncbi:hypothetical protein, partial [Desulfobulbus sp.]|uniref:hypothetical protein n=1 Tax=Desulfobulbus sp. TaxID=895 RepID=UPI0027B884D4
VMMDEHSNFNKEFIASIISDSAEFKHFIEKLIKSIKSLPNLLYVKNVFNFFYASVDRDQYIYLNKQEEQLKLLQLNFSGIANEHEFESLNTYPYSKINKKIKLDEILQHISDEEEILIARKKFFHEWNRDKAEFDTKKDHKS